MAATSTARSLAVPLSQNTAEVRDFRCMFTHDLRRKQKRWQDGFLTFHTFNKRIIVYDESRNRVGDAHWRQDHDFGEGEELKLQQGVLIDVQDQLGTKEQDISGVIVNRDSSKTPQLPSSRPSPWKAVTTIGPSGSGPRTSTVPTAPIPGQPRRAKTLSEILKTPREVLGRARLPESPYEQRHGRSPDVSAGREPVIMCRLAGVPRPAPSEEANPRPTKKQKRAVTSVGPSTPERTTSAPLRANKARSKTTQHSAPTAAAKPPNEPIIIESDDESLDDFTPERPSITPQIVSKTPTARRSKSSTAPVSGKKISNANMVSQKEKETETEKEAHKKQTLSTAAETDRRANPLRERPVNTLRSASGQPRRKLMYRELLPSNFVSRNPRSQNIDTNTGKERFNTPAEPSTSNRQSTRSADISRMPSRQTEIRNREPSTPAEFDQVGTKRASSHPPSPQNSLNSPALPSMPAETDRQVSDALLPAEDDDPILDLYSDDMLALDTDTLTAGEDSILQNNQFLDDESLDMLQDAPTLAELAELDKALVASKQRHLFPPASELARASVSAAPVATKKPSDLGAVIAAANSRMLDETTKRSPWKRTQTEPVINSPQAAQTRRSPLKKTNSDQTGRKNRPPEPIVAEKDKDKGPWSREAFDLFGWKPGKSKALITVLDVQ